MLYSSIFDIYMFLPNSCRFYLYNSTCPDMSKQGSFEARNSIQILIFKSKRNLSGLIRSKKAQYLLQSSTFSQSICHFLLHSPLHHLFHCPCLLPFYRPAYIPLLVFLPIGESNQ